MRQSTVTFGRVVAFTLLAALLIACGGQAAAPTTDSAQSTPNKDQLETPAGAVVTATDAASSPQPTDLPGTKAPQLEAAGTTTVDNTAPQDTEEQVSPVATPQLDATPLPAEPTEQAVAKLPTSGDTDTALSPIATPPPEPSAPLPEPGSIVCDTGLTPAQQEGPYYSIGSPERSSLIEEGMPGVPILVFGRVFDQECIPIEGAKLDFWLANVDGVYDNEGYTLRGHVLTDAQGYYEIESIEPTSYTGRPPHIHVKVFAPDGRELLTTQIYFAGSEDSAEVTSFPELYVDYLEPDASGRLRALSNYVVQR